MIRPERFLLKQLSLNTCDSECTSPASTPQSLLSSPNKSPQCLIEKVSHYHIISFFQSLELQINNPEVVNSNVLAQLLGSILIHFYYNLILKLVLSIVNKLDDLVFVIILMNKF